MFDGIPRTCSDVDPLLNKDSKTMQETANSKSRVGFITNDSPRDKVVHLNATVANLETRLRKI